MSLLAHACLAAPRMEHQKCALDNHIQHEIKEALRIQKELGCSYSEALTLAYKQFSYSEGLTP